MSGQHVLGAVLNQPWLITPEWMQTIVAVATRDNLDPEAVEKALGRQLANTRTVHVRNGVAVIPVSGPLFRHASLFARISGASSHEEIALEFSEALRSPEVRAIVLDVDSPGGQVAGTADLAELIYEARGVKPVKAYVTGVGASAAYWIASAAEEIVVAPTALAGNIGAAFAFKTQANRAGVEEIEIVSTQSPKKRPDPATSEGRAQIQVWADDIADAFISAVARNRGVAAERVVAEDGFGAGDLLVGEAAVAVGMVDRVGTLEALVEELSGTPRRSGGAFASADACPDCRHPRHLPGACAHERAMGADCECGQAARGSARRPATGGMSTGNHTEAHMPNQNPAPAADTQPVEITAALVTERAPAVAEAFRAEGRTAGATAERERILAIQAHGTTAAHRPIIEAAVADPNCTADQAAARILAAERAAREAQAGAIRGDEEELEAPTPNAGTGTQGGAREEAARVVAIHHQLRGESPARQGTAR